MTIKEDLDKLNATLPNIAANIPSGEIYTLEHCYNEIKTRGERVIIDDNSLIHFHQLLHLYEMSVNAGRKDISGTHKIIVAMNELIKANSPQPDDSEGFFTCVDEDGNTIF